MKTSLLRLAGAVVFLPALPALSAGEDQAPRHLLHPHTALTAPSPRAAAQIAWEFLESAAAGELGLEPRDFEGVYPAKEYRTAHNGVTHLVYRQRFIGLDVYNAEWVVNVDRDGRVLNAGGNLYTRPRPDATLPSVLSARTALRAAVADMNPALVGRFPIIETGKAFDGQSMRFARGPLAADVPATLVWFAVRGVLRPVWKFYLVDEDGEDSYESLVDPVSEQVVFRMAMTLYQAPQPPRGLVFEQNPHPNPNPGTRLEGPPPMVQRVLKSFAGDPAVSPRGWLSGNETAGNNTVTGRNVLYSLCAAGFENCPVRPETTVSAARDFQFPLELGPGAPNPSNFADAAATNLFYWVNRAHDLFYAYGFDEASGNFQQDNFNKGGVGGDPVYAYSHSGAAAPGAARLNNANFFLNATDGQAPMMNMFLNSGAPGFLPGFFTDGAYDAEVILHEYTHGVSGRLARRLYSTHHGGAMGEALSDFFALEFTVPEGAPPDGVYPMSEYFLFRFGTGIRTRPASTNLEVNPLTFANFGNVRPFPQVHADGEIFMQALWDMRANLIQQYGEREGRRRGRLLVMDGMKLAVPAATMVDMRDAILLADRVDFNGASQSSIWAAFAKRGLGALAQAGDGDSIHISPSFEVPKPEGALRFYDSSYIIGDTVRIVLADSNLDKPTVRVIVVATSGDFENVTLRRQGAVWTGSLLTYFPAAARGDGALSLVPGDTITAFYLDEDTGSGAKQIEWSAPTRMDYASLVGNPGFQFSGERPLGLRAGSSRAAARISLPFDFPFYNRVYREVFINIGGFLSFSEPATAPCLDVQSMGRFPVIAPMMMEMRTNGRAQENEDVYLSAGADWVTFRWAAETIPLTSLQQPEPVNFAATLFADGRIVYHYGTGNKNLGVNTRLAGCSNSSPGVGLAPGNETFGQFAFGHDGAGTLENARQVIWEPPLANQGGPVGVLESPAPGAAVTDLLTVSGAAWDADPGMAVRRADILIDGFPFQPAATGQPSVEFCNAQRVPGCPFVGFFRQFNTRALGLKTGRHTIQIRATNRRGVMETFPAEPVEFHVAPGESGGVSGALEEPSNGAAVSGTFPVVGHVVSQTLRIAGVDVLIDGINYGRPPLNVARTDVCGPIQNRSTTCPAPGFRFNVNTRSSSLPVSDGTHTLQVRVQDESGRFTMLPAQPLTITVANGDSGSPRGVLESPQRNERLRGVVRFSGYAYDPGGRITNITLYVDGSAFLNAPYGQPRPDACALLDSVAACPNIGFAIDFDTRRLPNGPHVIGFSATNDRGTMVRFPVEVANGVNVFVEN